MLRHIILYSDIYYKKKVYEFTAHSKNEVEELINKFKQENPMIYVGYILQELVNKKQISDYEVFTAVTDEKKLVNDMIQFTQLNREK